MSTSRKFIGNRMKLMIMVLLKIELNELSVKAEAEVNAE
ncbi:Transcriptional regulator [Pseudomonas sp. IT-P74]